MNSDNNQHEEQVENPTPEAPDVEDVGLGVQLEQAEARANEYLDSLQRERASFQNYKRRVEREKMDQAKAVAGTRDNQTSARAG